MQIGLDHVVIFVPDLQLAIPSFEHLGFNVTLGGSHENTENALIIFQDGTYLELLAFKAKWRRPFLRLAARLGVLNILARREQEMTWRFYQWVSSRPGPVDWCLRVSDTMAALETWRERGLEVLPRQTFHRKRPDGQVAEWCLGGAKDFDLPFLLTDITSTEIRVPLGATMQHPNGATGIQKLSLGVFSRDEVIAHLIALSHSVSSPKCGDPWDPETPRLEFFERSSSRERIEIQLSYAGAVPLELDREKTFESHIVLSPPHETT